MSSGSKDDNPNAAVEKTVGPGKTLNSSPDPDQTVVGMSDTLETPVAPKASPSDQLDQFPPQTVDDAAATEGNDDDHATQKTFIGKSQQTAAMNPEDSKNSGNLAGATRQLANSDTASDETFVPAPADDGTQQTFISKISDDPKEDLEDHFETLIEDAQSPGKSPEAAGGMVIGDYQVLGELGRGGMGVVYKARHRKLNRVVALKMILAGGHANKESLERFVMEARAVAHLQHPGIVQIFDIGEHEGLPYFSLEYVKGTDLKEALDECPQGPKQAAALVEKLCIAMQYAHDNNILHRDIKPANVLLDEDGEPKITDFGLAKKVDAEDSLGTQAGTIMGSPSYMPPEQARGDISSVTPRSDLYSLGAVLYEMLTGRPPFLASRPLDTVMQVVNNEAVSPRQLQPDVPVDLETICMKALQKDQAARYLNCQELADDLRRFINDEPILARPITPAERLWKWCRRNPKIAVPSGVAMSAIALTAVIATWAWQATSAQAIVIGKERDNVKVQRDEAKKQTLIAVAQTKIAEEQKEIADENAEVAKNQALVALDSIQYVVTEVDDLLKDKPQLTDVRISLMEALSKKWDEIDVELAGGLQGEAIPTQMAVRHKIAIAFSDLDKLTEADREFEKLYEKGKERIVLKNNSDASRSNLIKIATAWSTVRKRATNDPAAAVKLLEEAFALANEIFDDPRPEEDSPTPTALRDLRAAVAQNLGVEVLRLGDLPRAAQMFGVALSDNGQSLSEIREAPDFAEKDENAKDSATASRQLEYDRSAVALAYIQLRLGETDESLELYKKAIAGRREIFERRPGMAALKTPLGGFLDNFGNSYLWIDRPEDAEPLLTEALQLNRELYEVDPSVAAAARQVAVTYYRLGTLNDVQKKGDKSAEMFQKCRSIREQLVENSPDRKNKIGLMLVEARLGNIDAANALIDELGNEEAKDPEVHLDRSRALAQLSRKAESEDDQTRYRNAALTALERAVNDGYSDPFRLNAENDLDPLHEELRFKAVVAKLSTNAD